MFAQMLRSGDGVSPALVSHQKFAFDFNRHANALLEFAFFPGDNLQTRSTVKKPRRSRASPGRNEKA
jgi:hypothetical protein